MKLQKLNKPKSNINFDISKHFTPLLRIIFIVSMFVLTFSIALSVQVHTNANQITVELNKANEVISVLAFDVFLGLFGIILILLGLSIYGEAKKELKEWRKIYHERQD